MTNKEFIPIRLDTGKPQDAVTLKAAPSLYKPYGRAVSQGLEVPNQPKFEVVRHALALIDRVHGDGDLIGIIVERIRLRRGTRAGYDPNRRRIVLDTQSITSLGDVIHEVFHVLDDLAFETTEKASENPEFGVFAELITAIKKTVLWQKTKAIAFEAFRFVERNGEKIAIFPYSKQTVMYILDNEEWLARAYVQYIGIRSADPELLQELGEMRSTLTYQKVYDGAWQESDFLPIAQAFDNLFLAQRWLK